MTATINIRRPAPPAIGATVAEGHAVSQADPERSDGRVVEPFDGFDDSIRLFAAGSETGLPSPTLL